MSYYSEDTCDHNLPLDVHCDACETAPASDPVPVEGAVLPDFDEEYWDDIQAKLDCRERQLAEAITQRDAARKESEKSLSRREHTVNWFSSHYGKLEDWARRSLPEPWCTEFFSCVANGLWAHDDTGAAYTCKAGFKVVPSNYFRMDTAEGQLIRDQTSRAEIAEERATVAETALANEKAMSKSLRNSLVAMRTKYPEPDYDTTAAERSIDL